MKLFSFVDTMVGNKVFTDLEASLWISKIFNQILSQVSSVEWTLHVNLCPITALGRWSTSSRSSLPYCWQVLGSVFELRDMVAVLKGGGWQGKYHIMQHHWKDVNKICARDINGYMASIYFYTNFCESPLDSFARKQDQLLFCSSCCYGFLLSRNKN